MVSDLAFGVVALAAVTWLVRTLSRVWIFTVGRDIEYDLRNELLERVHVLGPSFFRRMPTGEIMSRATNDLGQVRLLLGFGLASTSSTRWSLRRPPSASCWRSRLASLSTLSLPYPRSSSCRACSAGRSTAGAARRRRPSPHLADRAQENLAGLRVVRAYGLEGPRARRFDRANQEAVEHNMRLVTLRGLDVARAHGRSELHRHAHRDLGGRQHGAARRAERAGSSPPSTRTSGSSSGRPWPSATCSRSCSGDALPTRGSVRSSTPSPTWPKRPMRSRPQARAELEVR